jgi:hypothetical protein
LVHSIKLFGELQPEARKDLKRIFARLIVAISRALLANRRQLAKSFCLFRHPRVLTGYSPTPTPSILGESREPPATGYQRKERNAYETPEWVTLALDAWMVQPPPGVGALTNLAG